jgi:hypothetical protein
MQKSFLRKYSSYSVDNLSTKSSCLDTVATFFIKDCAASFSEIITYLGNSFFRVGHFPSRCKLAALTPFFMKPALDKDSPSTYKSISKIL